MRMKASVSLLFVLFFSLAAEAQSLPTCSDPSIDLRTVASGFQCKTARTGVTWTRVQLKDKTVAEAAGETWQDPGGFIWTDNMGTVTNKGILTQWTIIGGEKVGKELLLSKGAKLCRKIGARLPTVADFNDVTNYDAYEVLPNFIDHVFWTSSVPSLNNTLYDHPIKEAYTWSPFSTLVQEGHLNDEFYDDKKNAHVVRCVFGDFQ